MSEKICMFCPHLEYAEGSGGEYSEPAKLKCAKKHFSPGGNSVYDIDDFRAIIVQAEECPDYAGPNAASA